MEVRKVTNDLLRAIEDGFVDKDTVLMACLKYMSEDDVKDMCKANDFNILPDEDDYIDEYSLDELDSVLNEKFKSATLWDGGDEHYVEVRYTEEAEPVEKMLTMMGFNIRDSYWSEGSDYEAYYIWIE